MSDEPKKLTASDIEREFERAIADQTLTDLMATERWHAADGGFRTAIDVAVQMHVSGRFDFLTAFSEDSLASLARGSIFNLQEFFFQFLPEISADPKAVVQIADTLCAKMGKDGLATRPYFAVQEWCKRNKDTSDEVYAYLRQIRDTHPRALPFVLTACGHHDASRYSTEAFKLLNGDSEHDRRSATVALGDFPMDEELLEKTFAELAAKCAEGTPEEEQAGAMTSILGLSEREPAALTKRVEDLLSELKNPGRATLYIIARHLFLARNTVSVGIAERAFALLLNVPSGDKGTIENIDCALRNFDFTTHGEAIFGFLEGVLLRESDPLSMDAFSGFAHWLFEGGAPILQQLALRWLGSGRAKLGKSVEQILILSGDDHTLSLDFAERGDDDRIFISRKAIGFLRIHPIAASSIVVSAMRGASRAGAQALSENLFEGILINYTGPIEQLSKIVADKSDGARASVKRAIKMHDDYIKALDSVGSLPELLPSDRQRRAAREKSNAWQKEVHKGARERSTLWKLFKEVRVLYGNSTVDYIDVGAGQESQRIENVMTRGSQRWEWPRLDCVDPVGLHFQSYLLRTEKRKS